MKNQNQIDRSLVFIFDIEYYSEQIPEKQAKLVDNFLANLSKQLEGLRELIPDTFSTGDGAIVSIGRQCCFDSSSIIDFVNFAIDFTKTMCESGIAVRSALNYSEGDRVVFGYEHALNGQYIQVGEAINIASRILSFCEPRELMISDSVYKLLKNNDLLDNFRFFHNVKLLTKHGHELNTYTYFPPEDQDNILYSPNSPLHHYKRFAAFPPIKAETLLYFMSSGLETELRRTISNAYDAIGYINVTKTFLSSTEVMQVLTLPNYDPEDIVYVVSRNDRKTHFWTQKRRYQYLSFLKGNAKRHAGHINQKRIMVFDEELANTVMPSEDIHNFIEELQDKKTFYSFPSSLVYPYEKVSELVFGFTLSTKHKYVIIPIPDAEINMIDLRPDHIGELLKRFQNYSAADGPMKAIICADEKYVEALIAEFENMINDPMAILLK